MFNWEESIIASFYLKNLSFSKTKLIFSCGIEVMFSNGLHFPSNNNSL